MRIGDRFVLPDDVEIRRAGEIRDGVLDGVEHGPDDWVITRPRSRAPSSLIGGDLAGLLQCFRGGDRIVDAVIAYAASTGADAHALLERAAPALARFTKARWLVPAASVWESAPRATYRTGDRLAGHEILECVHVLEDVQVYRAAAADGRHHALKVIDENVHSGAASALAAEATVLRHLDGSPAPALVDLVRADTAHVLVMEWCDGVPVTAAADQHRAEPARTGRPALHRLILAVLDAYVSLHDRGVLHGDVHPGNVLLDAGGRVRILDFGLAQPIGSVPRRPLRGGVPEFYDPAMAAAQLERRSPPPATVAAEQYSLAALCHRLATGSPYLRIPAERDALMRDVVHGRRRTFIQSGAAAWPRLEVALATALSPRAEDRFESVAAFAAAVRAAGTGRRRAAPAGPSHTGFIDRLVADLAPGRPPFAAGVPYGPRATVMYGAAGIAYYLLHTAVRRRSADLLASADQWARRAAAVADEPRGVYDPDLQLDEDTIGAVSPYHTRSGIEVVRGLVAASRGDARDLAQAVHAYITATGAGPTAGHDATVGSSSVLVGAAQLAGALRAMGGPDEPAAATAWSALHSHTAQTLTSVWDHLDGCGPIGSGTGPAYTGIAHGWAGMMHAALVAAEELGTAVPAALPRRLSELADLAQPDGRGVIFPAAVSGPSRSARGRVMPSWCNGAPGQVHLWNAAHRVFGDAAWHDLAVRCAWNAAEAFGGGAGICCGAAGRAFAMLNAYRNTSDDAWVRRARTTAARALRQAGEQPGLRYSLYRGDLGLALVLESLDDADDARQPLFESPAM